MTLRGCAALIAIMLSGTAHATVWHFAWNGSVQTIQGNTSTSNVAVGDLVSASFDFDDATVSVASTAYQPTSTIYNGVVTNYVATLGSLSWSIPTQSVFIYVSDNDFGRDGIGFVSYSSQTGVYASLENDLFGPTSVWASDLLPTSYPATSFNDDRFTVFLGLDNTTERIFAYNLTGTVTVLSSSSVPEPASWALMIGGFGMSGGTMRRSRTREKLA